MFCHIRSHSAVISVERFGHSAPIATTEYSRRCAHLFHGEPNASGEIDGRRTEDASSTQGDTEPRFLGPVDPRAKADLDFPPPGSCRTARSKADYPSATAYLQTTLFSSQPQPTLQVNRKDPTTPSQYPQRDKPPRSDRGGFFDRGGTIQFGFSARSRTAWSSSSANSIRSGSLPVFAWMSETAISSFSLLA